MAKIKSIVSVIGILLLFVETALLYFSLCNLSDVWPAFEHEEMWAHAFVPNGALSHTVKNPAIWQTEHNHPAKTVYVVSCKQNGNSCEYRYKSTFLENSGQKFQTKTPLNQLLAIAM